MQGGGVTDIKGVAGMFATQAPIQGVEQLNASCCQAERRTLRGVVNGKRLADTRRGACDKDFQGQLFLAGLLAARLGDHLVGNCQLLGEVLAANQVFTINRNRWYALNPVSLGQLITALDLAHDTE